MSGAVPPLGPGHRVRRALLVKSLLRSVSTVVVLSAAYFVLPFEKWSDAGIVALIVVGAVFVVALFSWQVWRIVRSPRPALRAVEALSVTLPVYLLGSAATVFLMSVVEPASFNEPLTRVDALYFTLTVFATVGFGDITAVDQSARAVVSVLIVGNLLMIAVGVKLLTASVKWRRTSRSDDDGTGESA